MAPKFRACDSNDVLNGLLILGSYTGRVNSCVSNCIHVSSISAADQYGVVCTRLASLSTDRSGHRFLNRMLMSQLTLYSAYHKGNQR